MALKKHALLWWFFVCTYIGTWACWIPLVYIKDPAYIVLVAVGSLMPSLIGFVCICLAYGRAGQRDFWSRLFDIRRISGGWLLFILFLYPLVISLAWFLSVLVEGSRPEWNDISGLFLKPSLLGSFLAIALAFGPLSEEIGWRGFALDQLQMRWGQHLASVVLWFLIALWQLPLFFIEGTSQQLLGIGTPDFWLYFMTLLAVTVISTWVYNQTKRSILAVIILHFLFNLGVGVSTEAGQVLPVTVSLFVTILLGFIGVLIAVLEMRGGVVVAHIS